MPTIEELKYAFLDNLVLVFALLYEYLSLVF